MPLIQISVFEVCFAIRLNSYFGKHKRKAVSEKKVGIESVVGKLVGSAIGRQKPQIKLIDYNITVALLVEGGGQVPRIEQVQITWIDWIL